MSTAPVLDVQVPRARGSGAMAAALAVPASSPVPGVVVIHEIYGLTAQIRRVAARFAEAGYAALAVDLFSTGGKPTCLARIFYGMLVRPLTNGVVGDLRGALAWLGQRKEVDEARLGVIGFCMGGSYALQLASVDGRLRSASVLYGMNPRPLAAVAAACPIVGSYPQRDFTSRHAQKLEAALEKYSVAHDLKIYPGARHSFFNEDRPSYDPAAADDAWQRTLAFFKVHLGSEPAAAG